MLPVMNNATVNEYRAWEARNHLFEGISVLLYINQTITYGASQTGCADDLVAFVVAPVCY